MEVIEHNTESLINLVQNEPALWDSRKNASEEDKDLSWKRITDSMGLKDVSKLRIKWNTIRSSFARELRMEKECSKSGSGKRKRSIYKYTSSLAFLRPHMRVKSMVDNFDDSINTEKNSGEEMEEAFGTDTDSEPESNEGVTVPEVNEVPPTALEKNSSDVMRKSKTLHRKQRKGTKTAGLDTAKTIQELKEIASSANSTLQAVVKRKSGSENSGANSKVMEDKVDKDWDYCRFIYHKIKDLPEGDSKDEALVEIQQVILRAKRQCGYAQYSNIVTPNNTHMMSQPQMQQSNNNFMMSPSQMQPQNSNLMIAHSVQQPSSTFTMNQSQVQQSNPWWQPVQQACDADNVNESYSTYTSI